MFSFPSRSVFFVGCVAFIIIFVTSINYTGDDILNGLDSDKVDSLDSSSIDDFKVNRDYLKDVGDSDNINDLHDSDLKNYKSYHDLMSFNKLKVSKEIEAVIDYPISEIQIMIGQPLFGYILFAKSTKIYGLLSMNELPVGFYEFMKPLYDEYSGLRSEYIDSINKHAFSMVRNNYGLLFPMPKNRRGRYTPSYGPMMTSITVDNMSGFYTVHYYGDDGVIDSIINKLNTNLIKAEQVASDFGLLSLVRNR